MKIRTVVVGTGNAARFHLAAIRAANPALDLVAIAGRDTAACKSLATDAGVATMNPDDAVRGKACDAVILAVPASAQRDLAIAAFRSGKHVLCEKPLASSKESAQAIATAWEAAGTVGMVNFCFRLIPAIAQFRHLIDAGACGELSWIGVEWVLSSRLDPSLPYNWKADADAGGGALRNFGSHVIDYLFHGKEVRVQSAWYRTLTPTRSGTGGIVQRATADEVLTAVFRVQGWCPVVLHISLATRPQSGHRLIARGTAGTVRVWNSSLTSPAGPFQCIFASRDRDPVDSDMDSISRTDLAILFEPVVSRFAGAIAGHEQPSPSIADGLRAAAIVDEVAAAAANANA